MNSRTPTLTEVLGLAVRAGAADLRVALPGRVERYDLARGTVDVQPLLRETTRDDAGELVAERLPVLTGVPLVFPGAGGFALVFPVQVGDQVLLVFADRSLDGWRDQGAEATPADERRHALSDAIAIPGLMHTGSPAATADHAVLGASIGLRLHLKPGVVELGEVPVDAAALASRVEARLSALEVAMNTHVHTVAAVPSVGTPPPVIPTLPAAVPLVPGPAVASSLFKLSG